MIHREEAVVGDKTIVVETGLLAGQANGAVTVRCGDTFILATATASAGPREGIDFFPLTCDYEEKMYAAGKIPGGFLKRETRPGEGAILAGRLIDRPIRPLFPKGFRNDVQCVATVMSTDQENDADVLAVVGASAALTISNIPFLGPIGAVRVGYVDGKFVFNPTLAELATSELDLVVAGTADAVMMVEAGASEVSEAVLLEAIKQGHEALQALIQLQLRLREVVGVPKKDYPIFGLPAGLKDAVREHLGDRLPQAVQHVVKQEREAQLDVLRSEALARFAETYGERDIKDAFEGELKRVTRTMILEQGIRPDGRDLTTVRPISCQVGLLPRTHGSGLFTRGQTQVLSTVTLGPMRDAQIIDSISPEESKRFMHQYNFPPYSVGEARPLRSPGRREIGHGALAERSVGAVVPSKDEFPYVIRLVSEVLSSNGSTSMGSVCASILALMDAGVPIKAPVAGVAMGLITDDAGRFAVLTDIQGMEDALGDMDFKVAGTARGVTGLQMDIKVKGITPQVMEQALAQALEGRMFILGKMVEVISTPRATLSAFAPRIMKVQIAPDKIGTLIGPGGKTIRRIQEETKVTIEVEDDGTVLIASSNEDNARAAVKQVEALTKDLQVGETYQGTVKRIMPFGAFVEVLPGKEGLVRIGELSTQHVATVEDVVNLGDPIEVKVIEIDSQGRVNLSHRQTMPGGDTPAAPAPERGGFNRGGFNQGGDRGGFNQGGDRGGFNRGGDRGGFNRGGEGGDRGGFNRGGDRGGFNRDAGPGPRPPGQGDFGGNRGGDTSQPGQQGGPNRGFGPGQGDRPQQPPVDDTPAPDRGDEGPKRRW